MTGGSDPCVKLQVGDMDSSGNQAVADEFCWTGGWLWWSDRPVCFMKEETPWYVDWQWTWERPKPLLLMKNTAY
jgi:hypothetical protein